MKLKILDCTIRDGGHLNKWYFDPLCVKASYYAALKSGVEYFEIGYRVPDSVKGLGEFAYCRDQFIFDLLKPSEKCKLTVMIDAGKSNSTLLKKCDPGITPIRAIRVAAYPYELIKAMGFLEDLKAKGYEVFLNLMASSELTEEHYKQLSDWDNKGILNSINFADSFGSFLPKDIPIYIKKLRDLGFDSIGFHPHNNLQMAFANTLRAMEEEGLTYIDASAYGMGRGAGNLQIEVLLGYLEKMGANKYNVVPYLDIIERFYKKAFEILQWGYKIESFMSGLKNIHPYYVGELFDKHVYTVDEIWNTLDIVKEQCPISYSSNKLAEALDNRFFKPLTQEMASNVCKKLDSEMRLIPANDAFTIEKMEEKNRHPGKKFLVIATGRSILEYKDQINKFINTENCVTIGVNYLQNCYDPDYHMFVNRKRFLNYASSVGENSVLLIPSFFGREIVNENYNGRYSYFNVDIVDNLSAPPVEGINLQLVNLNVSICAILMAYQMGASEIYAVGIDGYVDEFNKKMVYFYNEDNCIDDQEIASYRYEKLSKELNRTNQFLQEKNIPFSIITPTSHKRYFRPLLDIE